MQLAPRQLDFAPATFLRDGHLQTIAGLYWPTPRTVYRAKPHLIRLSDGDQFALHDDCPPDWKADSPVVLLLHGLAGSHDSGYMVRIMSGLVARGVRTFRMDMRGVGAAKGLARLPPHAGRTQDAAHAIRTIETWCPQAALTLVGFSMGGNICLGTLADAAGDRIGNLSRGIAVSPPVDLSRCCRDLKQGIRRLYDRYLAGHVLRQWRSFGGHVPSNPPRSIYDFDDSVTAPVSGFRDAEDYYSSASSGPRLRDITLPTRILAAQDDPMVSFAAIEQAPRSASVELYVTRQGGHLGYVASRRQLPQRRWLDRLIVDWVCDWTLEV